MGGGVRNVGSKFRGLDHKFRGLDQWTTFRLIALDLVERVAWDLSLALPPSTSHTTPS